VPQVRPLNLGLGCIPIIMSTNQNHGGRPTLDFQGWVLKFPKDKSHPLDGHPPQMAVSNPRTSLHFYKQTPQVWPPRHAARKPNLIHTQSQREKHQRRNKVAEEIEYSHQVTKDPPQSSARGTNAFLLTSHTSASQLQKFHSENQNCPSRHSIPPASSRLTLFPPASIIPCTSPAEGG
jgi:hypothetical protein